MGRWRLPAGVARAPTVGAATDARGCARVAISVPLVPSLRQGLVFTQWFMVDAGLRASNGLSMTMQ